MSSAGNNFYLQFFQSVLLPAGWAAPPQHIGEGTPAERLDLGCYSAHIFSRSVVIHGTILRQRTPSKLLSGTQFSPSRIGAARTVCRPAVVIQRIISSGRSRRDFHGRVVIPHTFCSFAPPCPVLLCSTHFIPENNAVVIGSTIQPCWISAFCHFFLLLFCAHFTICRTSAGLLSAAQFVKKNAFTPVYCCYTKHNSKNFFRVLLFAAHFTKSCIFPSPVVTVSTVFPYAGCGCYRQHNSALQDFFFRGC